MRFTIKKTYYDSKHGEKTTSISCDSENVVAIETITKDEENIILVHSAEELSDLISMLQAMKDDMRRDNTTSGGPITYSACF